MNQFTYWPGGLFWMKGIDISPVPRSRSGGRTLGGPKKSIRTDTGFWEVVMRSVMLRDQETRRWWNAIRTELGGVAGLAVIPVYSEDTAPWPSGKKEPRILVPHSDGSSFSDGSLYTQNSIRVTNVDDVSIGARSIRLRIEAGDPFLSGVRFSYNHALYETGFHGDPTNGVLTCPIFPAVRAPIPAGSDLNFDNPTCLVHLKEDRGMDGSISIDPVSFFDVSWIEATDYWSDLAAGVL